MNITDASISPPRIAPPLPSQRHEARDYQGIPGIEKMPGGRLFATWYTGGTTECRLNYAVLAYSDDDGLTWREVPAIVHHPHPDVRVFDATLWRSPEGVLYWFWAQGCGGEDGIQGQVDEVFDALVGVWCAVIENPEEDAGRIRFGAPRRLSHGIMLNKPTVLADGTWALPCSLWSTPSIHREARKKYAPVYGTLMIASSDGGRTFVHRGTVDVTGLPPPPTFDEPMFLEKRDGRLACYLRCTTGVAVSYSRDGGATWTRPVLTDFPGCDTRFFIRRLASGRVLLIHNDSKTARENLTAFLSEDDGETWPHRLLLDARLNVSYPDAMQDQSGNIYITFDYERQKGGHLLLSKITEADILSGQLGEGSFLSREISHTRPVPASLFSSVHP